MKSPIKSQLSAIVVEDEELAQDLLQSYISKTAWLRCAGVCEDAMQALSLLHEQRVDIIFLDVNLPQMSGMELLKTLQTSINELPAIVLTTAYSDYALESYDLSVVDYLLKPFSFERYIRAVNKATTWLRARNNEAVQPSSFAENTPQSLLIRDRSKEFELPFGEILYCESYGNYVKIHTRTASYMAHQTLKSMEALLPESAFCRIHKTVIVALSAIERLEGNTVVVNNRTFPIGITYNRHVARVLKLSPP
jgi:DNA-binding LytR/AlgR family response regulator